MKHHKHKQHVTLTLTISTLIFLIQCITVLLVTATVYILVRTGVIAPMQPGLSGMQYMVILMAIVSLLIGFVVAVIAGRWPVKPINRVITQMNRLASGDFKARLQFGKPLRNHRAFADLSESFNKMAEDLENTEMLRGDFINNFSHEFKTPIVSIAGFAKLLKRGNLTEAQRAEYLNIIEEESLRLAAMATNVLNLTKIENQAVLTDVSTFNLSEQIRACVLLLENKWEKKQLEFRLQFPEYDITANEEMLKQVWINLLDNAIKFSPEAGRITVNMTAEESGISVSVTNGGNTISHENQEKIFHKFYQVDESHAAEGNGIGLAIVKRVTELHKGTVSVRSEYGATTFTVMLPKS